MKKMMLFLIIWVFVKFSFAQITLTYEDIRDLIGNQNLMRSDTTGISVNVGSAGGNQTWDFSNQTLPNGFDVTFTFKEPAGSPYVAFFPTATFLFEEESAGEDFHFFGYSYHFLDPTSFDFLGFAFIDTVSGYGEVNQEEGLEEVTLPLNYGDRWTEVSHDTSDYGYGSELIGYDSTETVIDAWGTIITPAGTFECLRLKDMHYSQDSVYFQGTALYGFSEQNISYDWIGRDAMIFATAESQDGETNPAFTTAQTFTVVKETRVVGIHDNPGSNIVSGFDLEQNYPNPFNAQTAIRYSLWAAGEVELEIYNAAGMKIQTLVKATQNAGQHTVNWDAGDFPSGIYFYQLRARSQKRTDLMTRKMILLK
jgi:hypothetical protein